MAAGKPMLVRLRTQGTSCCWMRPRGGPRNAASDLCIRPAPSTLAQDCTAYPRTNSPLKRSIGELASIGRNINQIAKAVNEGGRAPGSVKEEFRAMLKICEALRDNSKALLKANEISWQTGEAHGEF